MNQAMSRARLWPVSWLRAGSHPNVGSAARTRTYGRSRSLSDSVAGSLLRSTASGQLHRTSATLHARRSKER
jgi:hypothetical protein